MVFDIDNTIAQSEPQHQDASFKSLHTFGVTEVDENWVDYAHITDSYILKKNQANIRHNADLIVGSNHFFQRQEIVLEAVKRAKLFYNYPEFDNIIAFGDGLWNLTTAGGLDLKFVGIGEKAEACLKTRALRIA